PEPIELAHVIFDFRYPDQLLKVHVSLKHTDGQAIRFGDSVEIVSCHHRAAPRHVLHDRVGIAGYVFSHHACQQPCPAVVQSPGSRPYNDLDRLPLIERTLRLKVYPHPQQQIKSDKNNLAKAFHSVPPFFLARTVLIDSELDIEVPSSAG